MLSKKTTLLCIFLLPALLASCLPFSTALPTAAPGAASTYAAETLQALAPTKTLLAQLNADRLTSQAPTTATSTSTSLPPLYTLPPSSTPAPFASITAQPATLPPTAALVTIIALSDTNCRSGPGKDYERLGFLLKGEESTVHGRSYDDTWWLIANLDKPGGYCWVWSETTAITGDTAGLPILSPPTQIPGMDFALSFVGTHACGAETAIVFQIINVGTVDLYAAEIIIRDAKRDKTIFGPETYLEPYLPASGKCPPGSEYLPAGETGYFAIIQTNEIPSGMRLRAIISLCEKVIEGQLEEPKCVEKKVVFDL